MSRYDIYGRVHKAVRACLFDATQALGRADPADDCEVRGALARLEEMLAFCELHLEHENEFVHRAMEARRPGSAGRCIEDHVHHEASIDALREAAGEVGAAAGNARGAALHALYRKVAVFASENLEHMEREEAENNAVLQSAYSDAEIAAIERELVASLPPGVSMQTLRWFLPAMCHPERVAMLAGMAGAPAQAREAAWGIARSRLAREDLAKLEAALAQREAVATLTS
ncbi:MAG TPA: hemerythrin domain-containing protein [Usitatibacter sp.]|nr:hemerythrin domain-containing protein [Usitatibacter sp.]